MHRSSNLDVVDESADDDNVDVDESSDDDDVDVYDREKKVNYVTSSCLLLFFVA